MKSICPLQSFWKWFEGSTCSQSQSNWHPPEAQCYQKPLMLIGWKSRMLQSYSNLHLKACRSKSRCLSVGPQVCLQNSPKMIVLNVEAYSCCMSEFLLICVCIFCSGSQNIWQISEPISLHKRKKYSPT